MRRRTVVQVPVPQHFADMPVPQILDETVARADRRARTSVQVPAETVDVVLAPI